ncbi:membrane-spanning 4-domains, subfamily A, member 17C.1 [Triplophysa dalaica]|uniref:membrane-spanning 4-domains, subfamily A, member 17C.1 n=1 Tax=Triplophysa dalaica TaxID=1582913 RepID=UPI0024E00F0C|nr:membrane-spanning 4-domains, subfamily A, member 17C.1 [Triplophysa dalaica]
MSSQVVSTDNATVIIQINPQVVQDSAEGQEKSGQYQNAVLKNFLKVQPKSLGTVQILTGIMIFLFGISLSIDDRYHDITINSGITYWGSLIYISAGSLSVAAENKLHSCVVKASLGMNVFSSITAGIAIIIMSIQLGLRYPDYSYQYSRVKDSSNIMGIIGILLLFSILQFIVSVCISAFACKATCDTFSSMVNISLNQSRVTEEEISNLNKPQLPKRN